MTFGLQDAAKIVQFHKTKGLPYDPAEDGFVFSKQEIEAFAGRTTRSRQARRVEQFLYTEKEQDSKPNGRPTN